MREASAGKVKNMLRSLGLAGMMGLVLLSAPASALDVVNDDLGGVVEFYMARLARAEARGEQVRIGAVECDSSCTLFLAARRSCVSPEAVFGFHAPWAGAATGGVVDPEMVAVFSRSYKPALRRLFLAHIRNTSGAVPGPLLKLTGLQLASLGYRLCGEVGSQQTAANHVRPAFANNRAGRINPSVRASSPESPLARWLGLR